MITVTHEWSNVVFSQAFSTDDVIVISTIQTHNANGFISIRIKDVTQNGFFIKLNGPENQLLSETVGFVASNEGSIFLIFSSSQVKVSLTLY